MAFALGLGPRIVGVTRYDTKPGEVKFLPRVGGFLDVDIETVARLKPDLVLVSELHHDARQKLRSIGIPVLSLPTRSIGEVRESILKLGAATGTGQEAARLVDEISRRLQPRTCPSVPRVLVTLGRDSGSLAHLVAAGPGTYMDELVHLCGAARTLPEGPAAYPALSLETLVHLQPDVIIDLTTDTTDNAWNRVPFRRRPRIVRFSDPDFSTPGIALPEVFVQLCEAICN